MHKLLVDCDNTMGLFGKEIDDGLALLYLLGQEGLDLMGISTVFGNGSVDQVHRQTQWLLGVLGRKDILLHQGAAHAGQDGTPAAELLAMTAADHPGEISLLALGPLTNLWAAAQLDPDFFSNLRRVYCMGGFTHPVRKGWRRVGELNFSADPRAAGLVLQAPCPVSLCNAHLCFSLPFGWSDLRHAADLPSWLKRILLRWLLSFGIYQGTAWFYLWDLVPSLLFTHPEYFERARLRLDPSEEHLSGGWLIESQKSTAVVDAPGGILDAAACRDTIFRGWRRVLG